MTNSVDPDQTPRSAASGPGLQFAYACLTEYWGKYDMQTVKHQVSQHNHRI